MNAQGRRKRELPRTLVARAVILIFAEVAR
jgi:hypothetical protein